MEGKSVIRKNECELSWKMSPPPANLLSMKFLGMNTLKTVVISGGANTPSHKGNNCGLYSRHTHTYTHNKAYDSLHDYALELL